MTAILLIVGAVIPLAVAPGLLFHYDVSPKTILLMLVACAVLLRAKSIPEEIPALWRRNNGRMFILLAVAQILWMTAATLASTRPWFSLFGSGWRQFGLTATLALLLSSLFIAAHFCLHPERVSSFLRITGIAAIVASSYGIAQYFDFDPFQPASIYHALAGDAVIVRPPGTFGHADYFGWWLAIAFFCGIAITGTKKSSWRAAGISCTALTGVAALLSGTRSALVAILVGALALAILSRHLIRPKHIIVLGGAFALLAAFYLSPAGTRLRARAAWSGEDRTGGARPLLWRDSLRMAAARPVIGYGPETFEAAFGAWQSADLARLYPDFHHESPHNAGLDALTSQGIPGLLLTIAWIALAFRAATAAVRKRLPSGVPLAAGLAASVTAAMFNALSLVPTLLTLLILGAMIASEQPEPQTAIPKSRFRWKLLCWPAAALLAALMTNLAITDFRLAGFQQNPGAAAYQSFLRTRLPGPAEDIYASRVLLSACDRVSGIPARLECWRKAEQVAARAIASADDTANAWYNLAYFTAAQNDLRGTKLALDRAIQIYPNWFKPHWALARLLARANDGPLAIAEAERAASLNSNHDPEVAQTVRDLRGSR